MAVKEAINYKAMMDDIGLDNQEAWEAAVKYIKSIEKECAEPFKESDIRIPITAFYDGFLMAKGISYLPNANKN